MGKTTKYRTLLSYKNAQKGNYKLLSFVCRGCAIRGRKHIWQAFASSTADKMDQENDNSYMTLEAEPENLYDPNAIKVVCRGEFFGTMGYVGREYTRAVKAVLDSCKCYRLDMADVQMLEKREINLVLTWEQNVYLILAVAYAILQPGNYAPMPTPVKAVGYAVTPIGYNSINHYPALANI